jgi:D-alanine-D-alanine ligase-like ATP-grasp enzyme
VDEARLVMDGLETRLAGVDVVTTDPSQSLADSGGVLLDVNPQPGIHHHYIYITDADHRNHPVAVRLLESLLAG